MRENPGPLVAVIALAPPHDAPITAEIEAISSSICKQMPPTLGISRAKYSMISLLGVMGYPAKKRHPA
jgi:hypothetical protein